MTLASLAGTKSATLVTYLLLGKNRMCQMQFKCQLRLSGVSSIDEERKLHDGPCGIGYSFYLSISFIFSKLVKSVAPLPYIQFKEGPIKKGEIY